MILTGTSTMKCPQCHRRVPLGVTVWGSIICPACRTRLQIVPWVVWLILIPWAVVAIFVARWIEDQLGAMGVGFGIRFLANLASILTLVLLGGELFGRLQIKPPPPSSR